MSDTLRVLWTLVPQRAPQPWLPCSRCGDTRPFESSRSFRVNANGKRLDVWLIYNCAACGNTWNRPLLKRRPLRSIDPELLAGLRANDPQLARCLAFDVGDLRIRTDRIETFPEVLVRKEVLFEGGKAPQRLEITFVLAAPVGLRLDRMIAAQLGLARNRLHRLQEEGRLAISTKAKRWLRKSPPDGARIAFDLSKERDRGAIAAAAQ